MRPVAAVLALLALAGCGKDEPIRVYLAPKEPRWRMVAAILPAADATWFFKVTDRSDRLLERKAEIDRLLASVKLEGTVPVWTLPEGWTEVKGTGDRRATLRFGSSEMTVVRLDKAAGGILANVNRWRGQLGLPSIAEADLPTTTSRIDMGGVQATVVDLEGKHRPAPMGPAAMGPPPASAPSGEKMSLDKVRAMFSYELPPGWTENPHPQGSRIFEFYAGEPGRTALVTFSILSDSAGGLAPNVNRWRGQVGLEPLEEAALRAQVKPMPFLGLDGHYVEMAGPERSMLCAFALGPPYSIFLKMDGSADVVGAQKLVFQSFARTFKTAHK